MKQLLIFLFIIYSCASDNSIGISEMKSKNEIIVMPYWKSKDSVEIHIPYTFKIDNNSGSKLLFFDLSYKPNGEYAETHHIVKEKDSIRKFFSSEFKYLASGSSRNFVFFFKAYESKKNINSLYWMQFADSNEDYNSFLGTKFNRIPFNDKSYPSLRQKIANDSLAFTFYYGEHAIIKVCKLNEYKFKTITTDDLLAHPEKLSESVFKP